MFTKGRGGRLHGGLGGGLHGGWVGGGLKGSDIRDWQSNSAQCPIKWIIDQISNHICNG